LADEGLKKIEEMKSVEADIKTGLGEDELAGVVGDYDGMIVRSGVQVTAKVLANPGKLRVIARAGVGVDNIDLDNHIRVISEEYNIDKRTIRDLADVEKIRQSRAQQQQAIQQAQMGFEAAKAQADAYAKTVKAPEPGSPAEQQMAQGQGTPQGG